MGHARPFSDAGRHGRSDRLVLRHVRPTGRTRGVGHGGRDGVRDVHQPGLGCRVAWKLLERRLDPVDVRRDETGVVEVVADPVDARRTRAYRRDRRR